MKSLMDIIKSKRPAQPAPQSAQAMRTMGTTAMTGKEGGPQTGPAMSNIAAQQAAQAGQAAASQQQLGQTMAMQQLGAAEKTQQEQQQLAQDAQQRQFLQQQQQLTTQQLVADQRRAVEADMATEALTAAERNQSKQLQSGYDNALKDLATQRGISEQEIFQWAKQNRQQLGAEKYRSFLEQTAHAMAMADQQYVDTLRREGQIRNLQDQIAFKKEATQLAFGQNYQILGQQFNMQRLMGMDARQFRTEMAKMDMNTALALAEQASKEAAYKNMLMGATNIATGIIAYNSPTDKPLSSEEQAFNYSKTVGEDYQGLPYQQSPYQQPVPGLPGPTDFTVTG